MNEKWLVIGYRKVSFKDDKTGKQIEGFTLYLSRDYDPENPSDRNVDGKICDKIFCTSNIDYCPEVGDEIVIYYNRYGKVHSIQVI